MIMTQLSITVKQELKISTKRQVTNLNFIPAPLCSHSHPNSLQMVPQFLKQARCHTDPTTNRVASFTAQSFSFSCSRTYRCTKKQV